MNVISVFTFWTIQKRYFKISSTDPQTVYILVLVIFILNKSEFVPSILWIIRA